MTLNDRLTFWPVPGEPVLPPLNNWKDELWEFLSDGINRAIERGIKPDAILDAIKNPLKLCDVVIDEYGLYSQRFIGKYSEIVINPKTGKIISMNPTAAKKAKRLLKQSKQ